MLNCRAWIPSPASRFETPIRSSISSVRACTTAAREVFAPVACRSTTVTSWPCPANDAATANPTGPAPTTSTSVRPGSSLITISFIVISISSLSAALDGCPERRRRFDSLAPGGLAGVAALAAERDTVTHHEEAVSAARVRFSSARKGGRERGLRPFLFPLPSLAELAPARRGREQRLRRDFAENELVVAKQRGRDRGDRPRSVEWCQVPLPDRALNLLDESLRDLPFRLDRARKVGRLHRSELLDERWCHRCRH